MLISNTMSAAGVDGKTASILSSVLNIGAGIALCFTPFAGLGASMIGSGIGGIVGGYLSESLDYSFEVGAAIGSIVGGIAGGKVYDAYKFSKIAQQGIVIGKLGTYANTAQQYGKAIYSGMPGFDLINKYSPTLANQLSWAHNYHYISNVMKYGGIIYNVVKPQTGFYGKELVLIARYGYLFFINLL